MDPLTEAEQRVLDLLTEAWNAFVALPEQHPVHGHEFMHAINAAKRIMMVRPVERALGLVKGPPPPLPDERLDLDEKKPIRPMPTDTSFLVLFEPTGVDRVCNVLVIVGLPLFTAVILILKLLGVL